MKQNSFNLVPKGLEAYAKVFRTIRDKMLAVPPDNGFVFETRDGDQAFAYNDPSGWDVWILTDIPNKTVITRWIDW